MFAPLAAAILLGAAQAAAPAPAVPPVDLGTRLNGVELACTGIGMDARAEPRWRSYGVRIELSDARNEYVGGGVVTVRNATGQVMLSARCDAPRLLLRLPPGRYDVEAGITGSGKIPSARIVAPQAGQIRVVLQFSDL